MPSQNDFQFLIIMTVVSYVLYQPVVLCEILDELLNKHLLLLLICSF